MRQILRIISESASQAWQQLVANKLRSFLSLLGVTIGIFCIIGVKSAVNSLEDNIRNSMNKLGNDVIYIEKFSWAEDPSNNYWKWMRRPNFSYKEFEALQDRLRLSESIGYWQFLGSKTVKWRSSSVENTFFLGITEDCRDLFHLEFEGEGRYFSAIEYSSGSDVCILGFQIAEGLFGQGVDPLDREINVGGRKLRIIGVLKKSGNDLLKPFNFDQAVLVGYNLARRGFNVRGAGQFERTSISVKAKPGVNLEDMKDEIIGVLRSERRLSPREESNFALNTLSVLSKLFDGVFGVLNVAGILIGGFALLVGMFSVANIMFVSVKERTNQIGIKMALGAKRWFILLEILIEAIILCLTGGLFGLLLIELFTVIISNVLDFDISLSLGNVLFGIITSVVVGVISGMVPAAQASKMDPVEAIRK
jgi:putative ABC transport system permease protein